MMRFMKRSERDEAGQLRDHLGVDAHWPLVDGSAMDDAMPRCDQTLLPEALFEPAQQRC